MLIFTNFNHKPVCATQFHETTNNGTFKALIQISPLNKIENEKKELEKPTKSCWSSDKYAFSCSCKFSKSFFNFPTSSPFVCTKINYTSFKTCHIYEPTQKDHICVCKTKSLKWKNPYDSKFIFWPFTFNYIKLKSTSIIKIKSLHLVCVHASFKS